ncbi:hypothetical protein [Rhizobium leguminosarum]|uniref:hypothetical protein n=1 Tax=Rhizobium leguminosarum TaxID=384 RepID=UPI00143F1635|nr:hypothetical protein [Rhizobium leguminosarum]NKL23690.1 hypothetical protein [Rhizobium leguminosarum bv. viciae]
MEVNISCKARLAPSSQESSGFVRQNQSRYAVEGNLANKVLLFQRFKRGSGYASVADNPSAAYTPLMSKRCNR